MQAWNDFLKDQEKDFGEKTVQKWLHTLKILKFDARNLYLQPQDSFQVAWFEEHIKPKLKNFRNNNGVLISVHLKHNFPKKPASKGIPSLYIRPEVLDPHFTFDSFHTNEKNKMAFKLLDMCQKNNLGSFNPIYIHGPHGCGKTHLLMSISHALQQQNLNVFYVYAQNFTKHVVSAIKFGKMLEFRKAYRTADVLIIDDIHILSGKNATQEEFFHTFNALHTSGKQIILSSHFATPHLDAIEPRLISRFEWGISVSIEKNEPSDLLEILRKKSKTFHFPLPLNVLKYLVSTFSQNAFLAFNALLLRANPALKLDIASVQVLLKDLIHREKEKMITKERLVKQIATHFEIDVQDLLGKSQTKELSLARKIAMYICREHLKMPLVAIGKFFGRDHSTVLSAVRYIETNKKDVALRFVEKAAESTALPIKS